MKRLAAIALALLVPTTAFAQPEEPANDDRVVATELLVPTPPEWKMRYDDAREKLLAGEFTDAAARFAELESSAVNRLDRELARAQRSLAAEWASKDFVFVHRRDVIGTDISARAVDRRTTDELIVLYSHGLFWGLGTGAWAAVVTDAESPAGFVLPAIGASGAAVGGILLLDSGRGMRYGVPQSIATGLNIGLEHGLAWTLFLDNRGCCGNDIRGTTVASIIWGMSTIGGIAGGALGAALGTTPGRSSWVGSTALWTGVMAGFVGGAAAKEDDPPPEPFAAAAVGLSVGTGIGLLTASPVSPSISRVRLLDIGGVAGGLVGGGLYLAAADEKAEGRAAAGVAAIGIAAGLTTAWFLTASMGEDRPERPHEEKTALARMRPMLMPSQGGAMLGVGGTLD